MKTELEDDLENKELIENIEDFDKKTAQGMETPTASFGGKDEAGKQPHSDRRMESSEMFVNGKARRILQRKTGNESARRLEAALTSSKRLEMGEIINSIIQTIVKDVVWIGNENGKSENAIIKMWCGNSEAGKNMKLRKNLATMEKLKNKQLEIKIKRKTYLKKKKLKSKEGESKPSESAIAAMWAHKATADKTHDKNIPEGWKVNHTRTEGWKVQVQAHKTDNDISMFDLQKRDKREIAKELEMRDAAKY